MSLSTAFRAAALSALVPALASAQVISTQGAFVNNTAPATRAGRATPNTPFWGQPSYDEGTSCNAGYYATESFANGRCNNVVAGTNANAGQFAAGKYLGSGAGNYNPADFTFAAGSYSIDFLGVIAGARSEIGYFTGSGSTVVRTALWYNATTMTTDDAMIGARTVINPTTNWGLYIRPAGGSTVFYSNTLFSGYTSANPEMRTALFDNGATGVDRAFMVGFEDSPTNGAVAPSPNALGDADFNDYMVKVQVTPEPASIALMATGLLGLAGAAARRRRTA